MIFPKKPLARYFLRRYTDAINNSMKKRRPISAPRLVNLKINGREYRRAASPSMTLLEFLREEANLTGTKRGCDKGECGCCTVLLNGKPILSCILPVFEAEGANLRTIEDLSGKDGLHPIQESFVENGAIQCGFCTPSMVLNAVHLLEDNPKPVASDIKRCVSGTICRCTGYTKIIRAIDAAAKKREGKA